ncbi:MAG TPA: hypothetical protein PLA01_04470 [Acetivibrio sp.]|nr:hypothetical protein [Acetivibrio sp.]
MKKLLCFFVLTIMVMNCSFVFAQTSDEPELNGIAFNGSDLYVAVGFEGVIFMSRDGINWSKIESDTNHTLNDVVWGMNRFIAVGDEGTILTSKNGLNWVQVESDTNLDLQSVAFNGEQLVAVGNSGTVLVSSNGTEWKRIRTATMESLMSVKWFNGKYMAVGGGMLILSSDDGITWEEIMFDPSSTLAFMDVSWNGSSYAVVGDHISVFVSDDGKAWQQIDTNKLSNDTGIDYDKCLYSVVWGNDSFLAVGHTGSIISSKDGLEWSGNKQITRSTIRNIIWTGDKYVAVGDQGAILLSYDSSAWEDLRKITSDLKEYNITIGQEQQLKVTLKYPYGSEIDITEKVTFDVDNKDIAFIDENGILKPLGIGQATAKIRYDNKSIEVPIKVSEIMGADEENQDNKVNEPEKPQGSNMGDVVLKVVIVLFILSALMGAIVLYYKKMERYKE